MNDGGAAAPAERLRQDLWAAPGIDVFAAIDGAAVPGLLDRLAKADIDGFEGLLRGALPPGDADRAPYLVGLRQGSPFTAWLLGEAWSAHPNWGLLVRGELPLRGAREHLRTLNEALLPDGRRCAFRWYDPRVLGPLLPACRADQLAVIFGPLDVIAVPGAEAWTWNELAQGALKSRRYARGPASK